MCGSDEAGGVPVPLVFGDGLSAFMVLGRFKGFQEGKRLTLKMSDLDM